MTGHLYVVGTPIGNLADLSQRARETLGSVDLVAAEDTRRTGRLLAHLGLKVRMLSFFEGNERQRIDELLDRLREGERVALVSDAGMPAVSDPGFRLLRAAVDAGVEISVVPGPSAVTAALVVSGLPTDRWVFEGFLPRRPSERRERLRALAHDPRTVVLFESPLRVITLLRDVLVELGDRRAAVARELTKLHEEVVRGRVSEVIASLLDSEPRGELVVVIEGAEGGRAGPGRDGGGGAASGRGRHAQARGGGGGRPTRRRVGQRDLRRPGRRRVRCLGGGRISRRASATMARPWARTSSTSPRRSTTRTTSRTSGTPTRSVAADFVARYHRLRGEEVLHLTGTDEHGLKLQRAAEAAGVDPQDWVDEMAPKWKEVWAELDIAYDDYIRTTEPRHESGRPAAR